MGWGWAMADELGKVYGDSRPFREGDRESTNVVDQGDRDASWYHRWFPNISAAISMSGAKDRRLAFERENGIGEEWPSGRQPFGDYSDPDNLGPAGQVVPAMPRTTSMEQQDRLWQDAGRAQRRADLVEAHRLGYELPGWFGLFAGDHLSNDSQRRLDQHRLDTAEPSHYYGRA